MSRSSQTMPFFRFKGTHRQVGQQYGEACQDMIKTHFDLAFERLQRRKGSLTIQMVEEAALQYRPYVLKYAPFFDEEIQGLADGAGLSLGQAYFLQLRAELYSQLETNNECTTYVVQSKATSNGIPLIGQNADLPELYTQVGVVMEWNPDDAPACLMLTPAGQISYIGINDLGMGVFANFLTCDGWRVGFPRYLLSRLALTKSTVEDAGQLIRRVERASSRNLIMLDKNGNAVSLETTPKSVSRIEPAQNLLVHSNHFIGKDALDQERSTGWNLNNSRVRLECIFRLLEEKRGQLNAQVMQDILRDRSTVPNPLCIMSGDEDSDNMTVYSAIAEPSEGRMWVAMGPPNLYEYKSYSFS